MNNSELISQFLDKKGGDPLVAFGAAMDAERIEEAYAIAMILCNPSLVGMVEDKTNTRIGNFAHPVHRLIRTYQGKLP